MRHLNAVLAVLLVCCGGTPCEQCEKTICGAAHNQSESSCTACVKQHLSEFDDTTKCGQNCATKADTWCGSPTPGPAPPPAPKGGRFVMPWICANGDPCGNDKSSVGAQITQLGTKSNGTRVFTDAAYENYDISGGKVVLQKTAIEVVTDISNEGVVTWAMIFNTDITEMRKCWANTAGFISSISSVIIDGSGGKHVNGVNFDWEPNSMTMQDGKDYTTFLDKVATHMHTLGRKVSICGQGPSGAALWDYRSLSSTAVDYVMDMTTYMDGKGGNPPPSDITYFKNQVDKMLGALRLDQYVPCIENNLSVEQLDERFQYMKKKGVNKVALWLTNLAMPLPKTYFPAFATL